MRNKRRSWPRCDSATLTVGSLHCTADRTALHCRLFDEMYVKVNELYGMTECSAVQTISLGNVRAPKSIA